MIVETQEVVQTIEGAERATFIKDVLYVSAREPLAMVRKRLKTDSPTRGAVLLIHGFGQNRYAWHVSSRSFVNYLAALGWDVFNIDLRGHGRSKRYGARRPQIFDEYIQEDVPMCAREAIEVSGHSKLFLVGHSMGGLVGYSVAATALRDNVAGVVSIGAPYRFGLGSRALYALSLMVTLVRFSGVLDSNPVVPLGWITKVLKTNRLFWDTGFVPIPFRVWLPGSIEKDILDDYLHRAFDPTSATVGLAILEAGQKAAFKSHDGSVDYGLAFESLQKPLLVIAGTHDALAHPSSVKPAYDHSRSRDKTYREFPAGHIDLVIGKEAPSTVWRLVEGWMRQRVQSPAQAEPLAKPA